MSPRHCPRHRAEPDSERHLMRAAVNLLATTGITAGLGMVGLYCTARWYRPEAVGQGTTLVNAMMMVALVAQLNLASGLPKLLAHSGARTAKLVRACYVATCVVGAGLAAAFALLAPLVSESYSFIGQPHIWAAFMLGCAVWGVFSLQDAVLTGLRATQWVLLENAVFGVLKLAALWFLLRGAELGILLAWVIPIFIVSVPVNLLLFGRLIPDHAAASQETTISRAQIRSFVGLDFLGLIFAQAYTALIPLLVFGHFGAVAAAAFSVTWAVAINLDMVAHNLASSLTVEGSREPERIGGFSRRLLVIGSGLMVAATVTLWLLAPLLPRLLGPEYRDARTYLPILVLANLPRLVVYLYHARLRAEGDARAVMVNQAIVGGITIVAVELAVLLGRGPVGVAWASLIGPAVVALAYVRRLIRQDTASPDQPASTLAFEGP